MTKISKSKLLAVFAVLMLLLNVGLLAFIFTRKPPPPHFAPGPKSQIVDKLNFDEAQIKEFDVLIIEHQKKINELQAEILEAKSNLYQGLGENDKDKSESYVQVLGDLQMEIEHANFAHFEELKKLCNEEQLPLFEELKSELVELFERRTMNLPE